MSAPQAPRIRERGGFRQRQQPLNLVAMLMATPPPADPAGLGLNCTSRCGASQYVQDVANPNWIKIQERFGALATQTVAPMHIYVDAQGGNDNKDGSSWAKAKKTLQAAFDLVPLVVRHNVAIHAKGNFTLSGDPRFIYDSTYMGFGACCIRVFTGAAILILDGGNEKVQIAPNSGFFTATASAPDGTTITKTGAGWTPDEFFGMMIEILSGPCAGQTRIVGRNTSDTITPTGGWTAAMTGAQFRIVRPKTTLHSEDENFFGNLLLGNIGGGQMYVQNFHFTGNCAYYGSSAQAGGSALNVIQLCTLDNAMASMSLGGVVYLSATGNYIGTLGFFVDPDTFASHIFDPTTPVGGVGDMSADGVIINFDVCATYNTVWNSAIKYMQVRHCLNGVNIVGSRILHVLFNDVMSGRVTFEDATALGAMQTVVGGNPWGLPAVVAFRSDFGFSDNIVVEGAAFGIDAACSTIWLGGVSGTNVGFGLWAHDGTRVFLNPDLGEPTFNGGAPNTDLTADGTNPIPQGEGVATWASIKAGTPAYDNDQGVGARSDWNF